MRGSSQRGGLGRRARILLFVFILSACTAGAVGFALVERERYRDAGDQASSVPQAGADSYIGVPRVVFRSTAIGSSYGVVAEVPISDRSAPRALTDVACDRIDATDLGASCLRIRRGVVTRYEWLELAPDFSTRATLPLAGIPSRTRLSPDGRLMASTAFVSGHSYMQDGFSTATELREVGGKSYGNLEEFRLLIDGERVAAVDRNIWGVTFAADGDTFYATAATGGTAYLVKGDLSARTLTAVRPGAECPALSPDGTRVAYKVARRGTGTEWGLAVLDLSSNRQVLLSAEKRSVDDQVTWLDDGTLLYGLPRAGQAGVSDVWALAVDDPDAPPRRFLTNAFSPAVVR